MVSNLTIAEAAFAVVLVTISVCLVALLAGAFLAGCRRVSAEEQDGFDPHADVPATGQVVLLAARAYQRQALRHESGGAEVHGLRTGNCGLADRRSTVLPLPVRARLDRASARYQSTRGVKRPVSPWGIE